MLDYRPIALLNVDYKILSKTLANVLVDTLPDIINEDQFCMKNRFIGDLIQQIVGIANYQRAENKPGFLAMLDFEKAFDSVNHEFTFKIMEAFGIPKEFIKWASLAFIDTQACCIINGKRSKYFDLPGGGRQGDNLYPLIFTIVVQALNHLIHDTNSHGIQLPNGIIKRIGQYADDSTLMGSCILGFWENICLY